ncbi:CoA transferase [Flavisphingomonas formosensis]|uniref:CoA transferase n=1 Tax=Flavisphingomonas formosensis TaxID=861534 RepID=UPI0012F7D4EA|nr:CoA transferase [Sphingomonas formosensis]
MSNAERDESAGTTARAYGEALLSQFGFSGVIEGVADHPALAWRRSGLMAVTGAADATGRICPAALASAADGALLAMKALVPNPARLPASGALLLGERARLLGLARRGRVSANGSCRLLDTIDGRIALNLARDDDRPLAALLAGRETGSWADVEQGVAGQSTDELLALGVELGLPIARDRPPAPTERLFEPVAAARPHRHEAPLVLDLSSLWAGPLAASLLRMAGAEVVKVESRARPDGARFGHRGFYDLLNAGKHAVMLDFSARADLARLQALIDRADVVIEGSRPRALRRLGIDRDTAVARGTIWLSLTAHPEEDRVGFGDDAAIEAGVATLMERACGEASFVGDAIADPLTGLHAALAGWAAWRAGEGRLIRLSLSGSVAHAMRAGIAEGEALSAWQALAEADEAPLYPLRRPADAAREPGADTETVMARC